MIFDLHSLDPRSCSSKPGAAQASLSSSPSRMTTRMIDNPPNSACSDLWYLSLQSEGEYRTRSSSSYSTTPISTRPNGDHGVSPTSSPSRKNKNKVPLKLEMCESVVKGLDCVFGVKCTFAHSESELQLRTLRERAEAGLIDIMTYRTRPCLYHVMTGGCPFGSRCVGIHDTRVTNTDTSTWLPSCRQLNALDTDVHIDWNSSVNQISVHHGCTFGEESMTVFSSYDKFAEKICQLGLSHRITHQEPQKVHSPEHPALEVSSRGEGLSKNMPSERVQEIDDLQKLQIALAMISKECPLVFKYDPSHLIFGRVCMVRQARAFDLSPLRRERPVGTTYDIQEIPIEEIDSQNPSHVIVREIAFGQNIDPGCPPATLWFGVPEDAITTCDFKDQLKQNRKFKKDQRNQQGFVNKEQAVSAKLSADENILPKSSQFGSGDDSLHQYYMTHGAFKLSYSQDKQVHDLIRSVMILEIEKMKWNGCRDIMVPNTRSTGEEKRVLVEKTATLHVKELVLTEKIRALGHFFLDSSWWPVNQGRQYVTDSTPIPSTESVYRVSSNKAFQKSQWSSFVNNLCNKNDATLAGTMVDMQDDMCKQNNGGKTRLRIFEEVASLLREGLGPSAAPTPVNAPVIVVSDDIHQNLIAPSLLLSPSFSSFFLDFEAQWKLVQEFYGKDEGTTSTLERSS